MIVSFLIGALIGSLVVAHLADKLAKDNEKLKSDIENCRSTNKYLLERNYKLVENVNRVETDKTRLLDTINILKRQA